MSGPSGRNLAMVKLTGYDPLSQSDKFKPEYLARTYGPILMGVVVHKVASRMGVNRVIPKWIPLSI
jgi:hypothetical protein